MDVPGTLGGDNPKPGALDPFEADGPVPLGHTEVVHFYRQWRKLFTPNNKRPLRGLYHSLLSSLLIWEPPDNEFDTSAAVKVMQLSWESNEKLIFMPIWHVTSQ